MTDRYSSHAPRRASATIAVLLVFALVAAAGETDSDPLEALLASGELTRIRNPVPATFLAEASAERLTAGQRARATEQLVRALEAQTNPLALMLQSATGVLSTPSMRELRERSQKNAGVKGMVREQVGLSAAPPAADAHRMMREMRQALADPWARGIAAAAALDVLGHPQAAARFYVSCLEQVEATWVPDACLDGLLGLGPRRAEVLLGWMIEHAETVATSAKFREPHEPNRPKHALPENDVAQLRNAALEGLGALIGQGELEPDARERSLVVLLRYADGKASEPFFRGAAEGLGRSRDPRAVEPLRRLARRDDPPEVKQAALRGLVLGFGDEAARRQLRRELDDPDPERQLHAAQALYEAGDEHAFRWALEVVTRRRPMESKKPDVRALVVRDLVELGGERARATLDQALREGPGNDWLAAWISVGLLELGDLRQLPRVEAALGTTEWKLDPRGFRSIWRAIKPFVNVALRTALSGGTGAMSSGRELTQATRLVGNLAVAERARFQQKASQREILTAQLRWQAADALVVAAPREAAALLEGLLQDPTPAVRLSAAKALAELDRPEAAAAIARAFELDFGEEAGVPRAPEVRAALLRAALIRHPDSPHTASMLERAITDRDPGVRFLALVATAEATPED